MRGSQKWIYLLSLALLVGAGCAEGSNTVGLDALVSVTAEAVGNNCLAGGIKIESGIDVDRNGSLGAGEVDATNYVCSGQMGQPGQAGGQGAGGQDGKDGKDGKDGLDPVASLSKVASETAGANCAVGGIRLDHGKDTDGNGELDAAEITSTNYVCDGVDAASPGSTPVVSTYAEPEVISSGPTMELQSATITVPGSGTILAIGATDVFCYGSGILSPLCTDGLAIGYFTLSADSAADADSGDASFFWLPADTTNTIARTTTFAVSSAGTYTYYALGNATDDQVGFWRRSLTLVYVPH